MPYSYLEDIATADIAFRAWGPTIEEMFRAAADATLNVMADDLVAVRPTETRLISLENDTLDMLLFDFLQELVFFKDAQRLLLRVKNLRIVEPGKKNILQAELVGEKIDPERHSLKVDIKAITLHQLKVERTENGWESTVVVDI